MALGKKDAPTAIRGGQAVPPVQGEETVPTRTTPKRAPEVMRVIEPFFQGEVFYKRGTLFEASHPMVKKFPSYFGPIEVIRSTPEIIETSREA